jgi:hypothetical protein
MVRTTKVLVLGAAAALSIGCADRISSTQASTALLDAAFISAPLGYEGTTSSFGSAGMVGDAFAPGGHHGLRGSNGLCDGQDFMGGGLGLDFLGGPFGGGRPFDHGSLSSSCAFSASSGLITCTDTRNGLTTVRTEQLTTAAGTVQSAPDSTTNTAVTHAAVTGTRTRRDSTTTTVNHTSDRTVTGLAAGSTQRTVNGTSSGTETSTGRDSTGTYSASRVIGDTISGIVVPVANGRPSYPTAGTVVRALAATVTYSGQSPVTSTRREVLTYDGSATARLTIVQDGTTKSCTVALPHGRPVCQ